LYLKEGSFGALTFDGERATIEAGSFSDANQTIVAGATHRIGWIKTDSIVVDFDQNVILLTSHRKHDLGGFRMAGHIHQAFIDRP
jgi:hypothetical protein